MPAVSPTSAPPSVDEEALERHLAEWAGPGGRLYGFNGATGIHRTLDDGNEMPPGQHFAAHLDETRRGRIRFNGEGAPPSVHMIGIGEKADLPDRDALGDNDPSTWPVSSLTGQREDPWKEQMTFPIVSQDDRSYSPGLLAAMTVTGSSR